MTDPYQILGVSRDASDDEIKKAYRTLSRSTTQMRISITLTKTRQKPNSKKYSRLTSRL